jgi:hypothetical protein
MSTRSAILEELPDGTYRGIYCHFDGYLDGVGRILKKHYQNPKKVRQLLNLGDISALASSPSSTPAYARDRGESDTEARKGTYEEVVALIDHDNHIYVFKGGAWHHNGKLMKD